jgi:hypothetical protein
LLGCERCSCWRCVGGGFRTATLKQAKSLRNICLCTWAMRLQRSHDRRWREQQSEVRATSAAPFDVNEGSLLLRTRCHAHATFLGGPTVDVALHRRYRSTCFQSSLRLARACVMALTISTCSCDVSSCVRLRDLASNRGGYGWWDVTTDPLAFFHVTTGSLRRV